jgi:putative transposase
MLFENASVVSVVLAQFLRVADKEGFVILAYCFMPDHVHLLIEGLQETADARKFIIKSKQCSAHAYAESSGGRLWQPFGYEHVVRNDEGTITIARYILENPVRAGIARSVLEYPFSGSQVYDLKELVQGLPESRLN